MSRINPILFLMALFLAFVALVPSPAQAQADSDQIELVGRFVRQVGGEPGDNVCGFGVAFKTLTGETIGIAPFSLREPLQLIDLVDGQHYRILGMRTGCSPSVIWLEGWEPCEHCNTVFLPFAQGPLRY